MKAPQKNCTFIPLAGNPDKRSGNKDFDTLCDLVLSNYDTFSVNDFFSLSRSLDLEFPLVKRLYEKWVRQMVSAGKVAMIPTCMDSETYRVC